MPKIVPIKELKDTANISQLVRESAGPVYVTKNGYDDMVLLSSEEYDRLISRLSILESMLEGQAAARGDAEDAFDSVDELRRRYSR